VDSSFNIIFFHHLLCFILVSTALSINFAHAAIPIDPKDSLENLIMIFNCIF